MMNPTPPQKLPPLNCTHLKLTPAKCYSALDWIRNRCRKAIRIEILKNIYIYILNEGLKMLYFEAMKN